MHAHAADARAALALENREIVGVDAVAHAEHTLAAAGTRRDAARDRGGVERREQRLFRRQRVVVGCVVAEPTTLEQARQAPCDLPRHAFHLGVVGWRERVEAQRSFGGPRVDAVEQKRVEVDVQVQRVAEALHEGDGSAMPARDRPLLPGAAPQRREDAAHEDVEHVAHERRVVGKPVAERKGQREHPLPHRHLGQHAIDEMRSGVGHAAPAARRAEAAALAREGDDAIEPAAVAVHADETMREDPAAQEGAELTRDDAGHRPLPRGRGGEERREFVLHDLEPLVRSQGQVAMTPSITPRNPACSAYAPRRSPLALPAGRTRGATQTHVSPEARTHSSRAKRARSERCESGGRPRGTR